jgi:hypothetical protein
MKKALCLAAVFALVASANAYIEVFVTPNLDPTGAPYMDPNFVTNNDEQNFRIPWSGNVPMDSGAAPYDLGPCNGSTSDLLVWGRFVQEPLGVRIFGLHFGTQTTGCMNVASSAIYRHQKGTTWDRWDNDSPIYMHPGCEGVGVAAAVVADGIQYVNAGNGDLIGDSDGDGTLDTFLIGGMTAECMPGGTGGQLELGLGTLGLIMYDATGNSSLFPDVYINGVMVQSGGAPPTTCQWALAAFCIPEPAGLLLIGLAGLFLRRR